MILVFQEVKSSDELYLTCLAFLTFAVLHTHFTKKEAFY